MRPARSLAWLVGAARAAWLVLGVTLCLVLLLEGSCQARERILARRRPRPTNPLAAEPWWPQWARAGGAVNGPSRYDPYRAWWATPYNSPYVNVDSLGRRRTVPGPGPGPVGLRVWFLGGSVIWGYTAPDSLTIPSLVARQLQALGGRGVEVVNLAQPSYNTTQGLATLLLELRSGRVPDIVISLDGINDVTALMTEHQPGTILNQGDLARRSAIGWRGFRANLFGLLRYSALVRALVIRPEPVPSPGTQEQECGELASQYAQLVQAGAGLGRTFGFKAFYFWQPDRATTRKPMTAWERAIEGEPPLLPLMRRCTEAVDAVMAARRDSSYVSLTRLFDGDTATIFTDPYGHLTSPGNRRIADRFTELIRRATGWPDRQPGAGTTR